MPLPVLHGLGAALGAVLWWVPNDLRHVALRHLDLCLPQLPTAERRRIARLSLGHLCKALAEAPAIWFGPQRRLHQWLDDEAARQALRAATAGPGGAIILCPHIGSWELAGMFCASVGRITCLYKPQKGAFDALILEGRERLGARLVPTSGAGVKALLQALRNGEMTGILPDQDPPWGSGVFAPLFGLPAHTTELIGKLAGRTGAAVWFCYAERLPAGRGFRFHVAAAPADVADAAAGAAALNRSIEAIVTRLPGQYWWSYRRYRRLPKGIADPYLPG